MSAAENEVLLVFLGPLSDMGIEDPRISVAFPIGEEALRNAIITRYPDCAAVPFRIAVDQRIVRPGEEISGGTEVALLPPFAGG